MSNSFFKFKKFTIYHDHCAMKVGTDGVLLGAWVNIANSKNALDIGCGSGLIAMMLAQRNINLQVEAIDIDSGAIEQSDFNIDNSPFKGRIETKHVSVQDYSRVLKGKYDSIVSNPPYFIQSLKSPNNQRSNARHTESLPLSNLFQSVSILLSANGSFSLIFPHEQKVLLLATAKEYGLYPKKITNVFSTVQSSAPKRILIEFTRNETDYTETDLYIEEKRHLYTEEYITLVKDFYLSL